MKISLNWLNEFVDLSGITIEDIDKRVNAMCCEIEEIKEVGKDTEGVVFGKILEVKEHPESDHLHILKVDIGKEVLQIVCGAPNVREGMITLVATVGGKVCGQKMKPAKLAGVESFGMCCSEAELGIGSDDEGICDVDFDAPIGEDIKKVLPIDDVILEIDNKTLTNRPDLWGHYGMAREFAAMFNRSLKPLNVIDLSKIKALESVSIKVETEKCYRYSGITVSNVTVKKAPMPMRIRLNYAGMRDINLLADITNYIMLELGQPMHAFDNAVVKEIVVREAKAGEKLLTLEGETHDIIEGAVLICDKHDAVAIAGIKGGLKSGITEKTTAVLFESATFDPMAIRKTSRSIGLITDASLRYEKSLDPELTPVALARIVKLLAEIDSGIIVTSSFSDVYNKKYPKIKLNVTSEFISRRIGREVSTDQIVGILTSLGFKCSAANGEISVVVPSFRATKDISIKEDLVEEVARMLNFVAMEPKPLEFKVEPVRQTLEHTLEYDAKLLLAEKYNANEVHSYIWNYSAFNSEKSIDVKPVINLVDTRNAGQSGIRTMLVPTLLKFIEENKEQQGGLVRIFEIGRCVPSLLEDGTANEEKHLAVAFASQSGQPEELFYQVKKYLVDLSENYIGSTLTFERGEGVPNFMHKINSCLVKYNDDVLGYMGLVNPKTTHAIDKKMNIAVCEVNFSKLCQTKGYPKKIKVPSAYQSVRFDLNFLVDKGVEYVDVAKIIGKVRSKILVGYRLVETFESEAFGDKKSMLFNFEINGKDHTLSGSEIDDFRNEVISVMQKNGYDLR